MPQANELFRFNVVRGVDPQVLEQIDQLGERRSRLAGEVEKAATPEDAREKAAAYSSSDDYVSDLEQIPEPYGPIVGWVDENPHASPEEIRDQIKRTTDRAPERLLDNDRFFDISERLSSSALADLLTGKRGRAASLLTGIQKIRRAAGGGGAPITLVQTLDLRPHDFMPQPRRDDDASKEEKGTKDALLANRERLLGLKERLETRLVHWLHRSSATPVAEAIDRAAESRKAQRDRDPPAQGFGLERLEETFRSFLELDETAPAPATVRPLPSIADLELGDDDLSLVETLSLDLSKGNALELGQQIDRELAAIADTAVGPGYQVVSPQNNLSMQVMPYSLPPLFGAIHKGYVQDFKIADLQVGEQTLRRYEFGEIAHIENALKGELRARRHVTTRLSENTEYVEESLRETSEEELHTDERFSLARESRKAQTSETHLQAGTKVSASYGPSVKAEVSLGAQQSDVRESASATSSRYARNITSRAVNKIETALKEIRFSRRVETVEEENRHEIDNRGSEAHVAGIYRYIDKIYDVQVRNYGARLMIQMIVPEPGALLRNLAASPAPTKLTMRKPEPPTVFGRPFRITDIQHDDLYRVLASRYGLDVEPPPQQFMRSSSVSFNGKSAEEMPGNISGTIAKATGVIEVPETHYAHSAWGHFAGFSPSVALSFYTPNLSQAGDTRMGYHYATGPGMHSVRGPIVDDLERFVMRAPGDLHFTAVSWTNPITGTVHGGGVVEVLCKPTAEAFRKWQVETYNAIQAAYEQKLAAYEEALTVQEINEGVAIQGRNPAINREIEENELKRGAVTLFSGRTPDMDAIAGDGFSPDPASTAEAGRLISFFEDTFEWEHMSYGLLPYYWARREKWTELLRIEDTDPDHQRFLQAGAAELTLPVRPGREKQAAAIITMILLTGGAIRPDMIEAAGEPVVILRELMAMLIELGQMRETEDSDAPMNIGEPFEVKVPTSLVLLQENADLNPTS